MMGRRGAKQAGSSGLALLVLGTVIALAPAAGAQTPPAPEGVEITPAFIQKDIPGRGISERILVVNHEPDPRRITLTVAGLGHDLDGAPSFFEQGHPAASALSLDAKEFVLAPGARKQVTVSGAIPTRARSLYAGIVAEFEPLVPRAGQIEVRSRVACLLLFRGPKPWIERVEIVDVQILPGRGGPARIAAAVKNVGNVHVTPSGTARVVRNGEVLATVPLTEQLIIPGFARRIAAAWSPPAGLSGRITIHVRTKAPPAEFTRTIDLGGGVEARPQAEIVNLRASPDAGGHVTLMVRNTGAVPVTPAVTLFARADGVERARVVLPQKELNPGASSEVAWDPALADGTYLITAQLKSGADLLDEATTDLRLGAAVPAAKPRPEPRAGLIVMAGLLLGLVIAALILRVRRRDGGGDPPPAHSQPRSREPVGAGRP